MDRLSLDKIIRRASSFHPAARYSDTDSLLNDLNSLNKSAPTKNLLEKVLGALIQRSKSKSAAEIKYKEARSYFDEKNYVGAVDLLKETINLNPSHDKAWFKLQNCILEMAQPDLECIVYFCNKQIGFFERNWRALHTKGLVLYKHGKYDDAIISYKQAIARSKKKSYWSYHDIGNCLRVKGDLCSDEKQKQKLYSEAESWYRTSIEVCLREEPWTNWLYHDLGYILKQQQKFIEAIKYFEEAIALKPDNAWHYHEIAVCYNEMSCIGDQYYSKAEEFARKAIELLRDPFEAKTWVHHNLARALEGQSRFDEAKKEYAQALFLSPNNQFAKDSLERLKDT